VLLTTVDVPAAICVTKNVLKWNTVVSSC